MPWYHCIAAFIHRHLVPMRATRRDNLDILAAALLGRRALVCPVCGIVPTAPQW